MSPYGVTRSQWVNIKLGNVIIHVRHDFLVTSAKLSLYLENGWDDIPDNPVDGITYPNPDLT